MRGNTPPNELQIYTWYVIDRVHLDDLKTTGLYVCIAVIQDGRYSARASHSRERSES